MTIFHSCTIYLHQLDQKFQPLQSPFILQQKFRLSNLPVMTIAYIISILFSAPRPMSYPVIDIAMCGPCYGTSGLATAFGGANPPVMNFQRAYSTSSANYPRMNPTQPPPYDGKFNATSLATMRYF